MTSYIVINVMHAAPRRTLLIAVCCGASLVAQTLAPVKDLPHTIGSASRSHGPFMFCTLPDPSAIPPAYASAVRSGARPFLAGWEFQAAPPRELAKVVLVTNLPQLKSLPNANCKRVQPLPAGGVDAMRLRTPYALVDKAADWAAGYTTLAMNIRNDTLPAADYVPRLKHHIKLVTQLFEPHGLDGYIVYLGEDFEWGNLHWVDRETSQRAFATPEGRTGPADSASFQHRPDAIQVFPGDPAK